MVEPLVLAYFVGYSVSGVASALLAKKAVEAFLKKRFGAAMMILVAAAILLGLALAFLMMLLSRMPISILAPIGVGLNLVIASLAAVTFIGEHINRRMISGYIFIVIGIAILSTQGTS
jgi:drug/metabolite transporter (DMT)-like permease